MANLCCSVETERKGLILWIQSGLLAQTEKVGLKADSENQTPTAHARKSAKKTPTSRRGLSSPPAKDKHAVFRAG